MSSLRILQEHRNDLMSCNSCANMIRPVVSGNPILSKVMLIGQAPGVREGEFGKPFAWTAGKTMFRWFEQIGVTEEEFRNQVYMAAVCRCFPGKSKSGGGDRVPSPLEISACRRWLDSEFRILKPKLIIPVGRLAIEQVIGEFESLAAVVGKKLSIDTGYGMADVIPLPHPSGASPWHRISPGKDLLAKALRLIGAHEEWKQIKALSSKAGRPYPDPIPRPQQLRPVRNSRAR